MLHHFGIFAHQVDVFCILHDQRPDEEPLSLRRELWVYHYHLYKPWMFLWAEKPWCRAMVVGLKSMPCRTTPGLMHQRLVPAGCE
jgi:hypothetical protein